MLGNVYDCPRIVVTDSGPGGLIAFAALGEALPSIEGDQSSSLVYCDAYPDDGRPYHGMNVEEQNRCFQDFLSLVRCLNPQYLVLASHTLSAIYSRVKSEFPEVSRTLTVAAHTDSLLEDLKKRTNGELFILGTPIAASSYSGKNENDRESSPRYLTVVSCGSLQLAVESGDPNWVRQELAQIQHVFRAKARDCPEKPIVVLGCTHFTFVSEEIRETISSAIERDVFVVDPIESFVEWVLASICSSRKVAKINAPVVYSARMTRYLANPIIRKYLAKTYPRTTDFISL